MSQNCPAVVGCVVGSVDNQFDNAATIIVEEVDWLQIVRAPTPLLCSEMKPRGLEIIATVKLLIVSLPLGTTAIVFVAEQEPDSSTTDSAVPVGYNDAAGSARVLGAVKRVKATVLSAGSAE